MEDKNKNIMKQHPLSKGEPLRGEAGISGLSPFGLGRTKPHHFIEMMGVAWENRDNLQYAWNILQHGVCDGYGDCFHLLLLHRLRSTLPIRADRRSADPD